MSTLQIGDWVTHFELDRIEQDGVVRAVPHQVMALLECLAAHAGEVVTKEALIANVWDGLFTSDEVISTAVYELRRVLGDDARNPRYIETIRKRGYRLIAPVRDPSDSAPPAPQAHRRSARAMWLPAATTIVVLLLLLGLRFGEAGLRSAEPQNGELAVADPARSVSAEACDAYLRGQHFLQLGTQQGLQKAVRFFTQAVEIQADLSVAYTGLADCYTSGDWGVLGLSWRQAFDAASAAAQKAWELDGDTPGVQAAWGSIRFRHAWDWAGAEAHFESSLEGGDCGSRIREAYAEYLSALGRHAEAIQQLRAVADDSPLSLRASWSLAWSLYLARRFDECVAHLDETLELHPNEALLHELRGDALVLVGDTAGAVSSYERAAMLSSASLHEAPELARIFTGASFERILEWRAERASRRVELDGTSPYQWARVEALRGNNHKALSALMQALEEHRNDLVWVNVDPAFDGLRRNPVFRAVVERMDLSV